MKGHIIVDKLSKSGNYISNIDWDNAFIDKNNKKGLFKMLIQPITNSNNKPEIRFLKIKDGYKVSGEAYIITGNSEKVIDSKIRNYKSKYTNLVLTEVEDENELW